jgi:hypothetical protein
MNLIIKSDCYRDNYQIADDDWSKQKPYISSVWKGY